VDISKMKIQIKNQEIKFNRSVAPPRDRFEADFFEILVLVL